MTNILFGISSERRPLQEGGTLSQSQSRSRDRRNYEAIISDDDDDEKDDNHYDRDRRDEEDLTPTSDANSNDDDEEEDEDEELYGLTDTSSYSQQFSVILKNSCPTMLSLLMTLLSMNVTMFFAGIIGSRLKNNAIFAGISLAATFADVSFFSFLEGFLTASETICSQQNGAKQYTEVGKTLNISFVSLSLISLPLILSWNYVAYFFRLIGVDDAICEVTHNYLMIEIFATPGYLISQVYGTYLQSMGIMSPAMYSSILYNILLILFSYIAISVYQYSYSSLAMIHVVCTYIDLIFIFAITLQTKEVSRTLTKPSFKEIFQSNQLSSFLLLGFSGCIMTCSEWWTIEILILISSSISSTALSSITILLDLLVLLLMIPMGIEITIASLIGNSIGSGYSSLAQSIGSLSYLFIFLIDLLLSPLVYYYGCYYIQLFTTDDEIIQMTESCLILLSSQLFLDGILSISYGILNAIGKQTLCTLVTVLTYLLLIIPLGWYLCIQKDLGISGLLGGLLIGSLLEMILVTGLVYYFCYYTTLQASFISSPTQHQVHEDDEEEEDDEKDGGEEDNLKRYRPQ